MRQEGKREGETGTQPGFKKNPKNGGAGFCVCLPAAAAVAAALYMQHAARWFSASAK